MGVSSLPISKECQVAAWPSHKASCKLLKKERLILAEVTGIPTAKQDVDEWIKYYDAPLKNCAIAAMNFPEDPHAERTDFLRLQIWHSGDASLPISKRFNILTVGRQTIAEIPSSPFATIAKTPSAEAYEKVCRKGRKELGGNFYGVVRIAVFAFFGPRNMPTGFTTQWKLFSINQGVARASRTHEDWWNLFHDYVAAGAKMRFCCWREKDSITDGCWWGGWTHNAGQSP